MFLSLSIEVLTVFGITLFQHINVIAIGFSPNRSNYAKAKIITFLKLIIFLKHGCFSLYFKMKFETALCYWLNFVLSVKIKKKLVSSFPNHNNLWGLYK